MTVRILHGDCRDVLKTLPDASVNCCITSPPYWGLRSYLPAGHPNKHKEIGSEPTLQEWVQTMVEVFREVRRVLRPDGVLFLNLGDAYFGGGRGGNSGASTMHSAQTNHCAGLAPTRPAGLKPKDLMGQPWRVAFALQDDSWWLRQELIWAKKNPMPESIRDRFTKAHEHVFLLTKSERYYFDFDAVQEPVEGGAHARRAGTGVGFGFGTDMEQRGRSRQKYKTPDGWDTRTGQGGHGSFHAEGREKGKVLPQGVGRRQGPPGNPAEKPLPDASPKYQDKDVEHRTKQGLAASERIFKPRIKDNDRFNDAMAVMPATRNPRSVRWLASEPFRGAHFATYPPELIEPFVLAGCPEGGTVLDPFGGSGTTGMVADRHHRNAILIDLDERNLPMATGRITGDSPLFAEVTA